MSDSDPSSPIYLWFDTEYSDLDLDRARILQIALMATDEQLRRLRPREEDLNLLVRLPADADLSPWVQENLKALLDRCRSPEALDLAEIDAQLAAYVERVVGGRTDAKPILAGNSVYSDMVLARKHLPRFRKAIHYRLLDVSTLKILWQDWRHGTAFDKDSLEAVRESYPGDPAEVTGQAHDAFFDIQASMAELAYYRKHWGLGGMPGPG